MPTSLSSPSFAALAAGRLHPGTAVRGAILGPDIESSYLADPQAFPPTALPVEDENGNRPLFPPDEACRWVETSLGPFSNGRSAPDLVPLLAFGVSADALPGKEHGRNRDN